MTLLLLACLPGEIPPCTQCAANDDLDGDGYSANAGDCDDGDAAIRPGADEVCNERDDDCNGLVDDEAVDARTWYLDDDGDGYAGETSELSCLAPSADWRPAAEDCDDADADVHPHADEICNSGVDEDCDGEADECVLVGAVAVSGLPGISLDGDGRVATLGDGDADGYDDLLVAPNADQGVLALLAGGPGWKGAELSESRGWLEGLLVSGLAGGHDVDGDGSPDAVVSGADGLGVLSGTATGSIGRDETVVVDGVLGSALALGDLDGDGQADVAAGHDGGTWLLTGPLTSGTLGGDVLPSDQPPALAIVDLDGDGAGELIVADPEVGEVVVVQGPPDVKAALDDHPVLTGPDVGAGATLSAARDMDGDGLADLLVGDPDGSRAWVWTGPVTADAELDDGLALVGDTDEQAGGALATPDLDGDGSPDLAVAAPGLGSIALFYAPATSGTLSFADADLVVVGDTGLGASLAALDLDGSGHDELALGGEVRILFGAGL